MKNSRSPPTNKLLKKPKLTFNYFIPGDNFHDHDNSLFSRTNGIPKLGDFFNRSQKRYSINS
jgi:hypothetical protein